jgi:Protein of unknown function (DUF2857)
MIGTKEAELTSAVMMYALRCLREGDQLALREMNFGPAEVQALQNMNMADLCQLESLRAHCLRVALNREVYWPMMAQLKRRRESEDLQHALIAADASLEMMQTFFGMSGREYARLRKTLLVKMVVGRPTEPTEEEIETLWAAWRKREEKVQDGLLPPEEYLAIFEETAVPIRAIWRQSRTWLNYN